MKDRKLDMDAATLFRVGFFVELALVVVAAAVGYLFLDAPFPFSMSFEGLDVLLGIAATVPAALVAVYFTSGIGRRIGSVRRIYERVQDILDRPLRELTLLEIVLLAAAAGLGEEVLFRGVIQQLWGLAITSLAFGALHALTPAYFVLATAMGLYLGWLFETTGNLLVPMVVHWLYDAVALFLLQREFRRDAAAGEAARVAEDAGEDSATELGADASPEPPEDPDRGEPSD